MRFTTRETELLLHILRQTNATLTTLIEKLEQNDYIRGRLLNQLFLEISKNESFYNDNRDVEIKTLLKRIKFKATPR